MPINNLYHFKINWLFLIFTIFYIIIAWQSNVIIYNNNYYHLVYGNNIEPERIETLIGIRNKFEIYGYLIIPIFLFLKFFILSLLIYIAIKIIDLEISFFACVRIIMISEFVMLIASIVKFTYFLFLNPREIINSNLNYPLSISQIINVSNVPKYLLYPIQQINMFEIGYWILLAYGIKNLCNVSFKQAIKITALSYGVGLSIWCVFIVFIQLQLS